MTKEKIFTGKYRLNENDAPRRLKLIYRQEDYEEPTLELYDGKEAPIETYKSHYKGNDPIKDPRNPDNLRANLKDLSRKLSDSGVFPPGFLEELTQRLQNNHWHPDTKK